VKGSTLKQWTETRWDSRYESISAIINNYSALLSALEALVEDAGDRAIDRHDLLISMKSSTFGITGFVLLRLLGSIKILSDPLKGNYQKLLRIEIDFRFFFLKF
jgi:hypothetical protein